MMNDFEMKIETGRLLLRRWRIDDAESLYKYASDGRVSELALWPRHTTVEMSRKVIEDYFLPNDYCFAITLKDTGEAIGCIGFVPCGDEHYAVGEHECELGYWLGFDYWNKGIVTEAVEAFIVYSRECLGLESLLITVDKRNVASCRVAEKCGFKFVSDYEYDGVDSKAYRLDLKGVLEA